jgi:hypothetical protein
MKKEIRLKLVGYFVLAVMVLNLVLFALGWINWIAFWGIIIVGAVFVYKVLPLLKGKLV